ncbi:hypothetical protein [Sorangium sp. So ce861]|uniref:pectate lyase family protein n=1 Tax=Sorangium sp. So ce861 TaxID=3133323 RepID=UPI003F5E8399
MNASKNISAETRVASLHLAVAPRRVQRLGRLAWPALGLLSALAGGGCAADAELDGAAPVVLDEGETGEASLALSPTPEMLSILDEREGWGANATGGKDGSVYVVKNTNDKGDGSLRKGLESSGKRWIVFDDDVNGDIVLSSSISVKSDKTVDARGHSIRIKMDDKDDKDDKDETALKMHGVRNVILINLEFDNDYEDYDTNDEGADAINIMNSKDIWIHHCEFTQWPDGGIDIKEYSGDPPEFMGDVEKVSVTWSRFRKIYQAMLWQGDKLSLGHSVCYNEVNARCPKIIGGRAHSYNNYIANWGHKGIQYAQDGGELYSQRNIFESGDVTRVNERKNDGKIRLDNNYSIGSVTFEGGSDSVDSDFVSKSRGNAKVDVCSDDRCWANLKNRLLNGDGVHKAAGNSL